MACLKPAQAAGAKRLLLSRLKSTCVGVLRALRALRALVGRLGLSSLKALRLQLFPQQNPRGIRGESAKAGPPSIPVSWRNSESFGDLFKWSFWKFIESKEKWHQKKHDLFWMLKWHAKWNPLDITKLWNFEWNCSTQPIFCDCHSHPASYSSSTLSLIFPSHIMVFSNCITASLSQAEPPPSSWPARSPPFPPAVSPPLRRGTSGAGVRGAGVSGVPNSCGPKCLGHCWEACRHKNSTAISWIYILFPSTNSSKWWVEVGNAKNIINKLMLTCCWASLCIRSPSFGTRKPFPGSQQS